MKLKLKEFLDNKRKDIECPDCENIIYKSGTDCIKCCICYGQFNGKEIKFVKNENDIKFMFPKSFDMENIEMLIQAIKSNKKTEV